MARNPSPWWWEAEQGWYVNYQGKRHFLGKHPQGEPEPKKSNRKSSSKWNAPPEILRAFHFLLSQDQKQMVDGDSLAALAEDFYEWCEHELTEKTIRRYKQLLEGFIQKNGRATASAITKDQVSKWLKSKSTWNSTTKYNAMTALQRLFNWGVKNDNLERNPIEGMEKSTPKKRTETLTPDEFEMLLDAVADQEFRDLLIVSYDSAGRPFEIKDLEARHIQLKKNCAIIPYDEAKGRKRTRTIYLPTERCLETITRLIEKHPEGPLFRNTRGKKWTDRSVKSRLANLDHVLGRRVTHYSLRHSRITDWLASGVDSHIVAKLAGHCSTDLLDTTYSHVQEDYEHMLKQAQKRTKTD